jgi:hypothetical protein
VVYCNIYRNEITRFESLFGGNRCFKDFPSFLAVFNAMVSIFQEERKNDKSRNQINFKGGGSFFAKLTRFEKWRVILFWFFLLELENQNTESMTLFTNDLTKFGITIEV